MLESPVLIADSQICYFEESTQFTDFQEKSNERTDLVSDFIPTSILRTSTSPSKKKSVRFELPTGKVRFSRFKSVKSNQKRYQNCPSKESFYQRFFLIIHKFEDAHEFDCVNSRLKKFYSWARAIDIYSKILKYTIVANEGMASPQIDGKITKNDESSKKFNKKLADNRALLIVPPSSPTEGISEMCLMDKDRRKYLVIIVNADIENFNFRLRL